MNAKADDQVHFQVFPSLVREQVLNVVPRRVFSFFLGTEPEIEDEVAY